jgi:hypothetical protein
VQDAVTGQHVKEMMAIGVIVSRGCIAWMIDDAVGANELRAQFDVICHKVKTITRIARRMQMR